MSDLFALRGNPSAKTKTLIEAIGTAVILILWLLISEDGFGLVAPQILPSPLKVLMALPELHFKDALVRNAWYSLEINLMGLAEAILFAVPLGFVIGLFPIPKAMLERYIAGLRYVPLPMLIGLFIVWFGIDTYMKVQFLAVSIFFYLLPAVVQRIGEVEDVYDHTVITLGATKWQRIRYVFIPAALPRVTFDIIILAAISWTYITVAEAINMNGGGIGAMANMAARASRTDKVFAMVIVIVLIGFGLDKLATMLDKQIFKFKYAVKGRA